MTIFVLAAGATNAPEDRFLETGATEVASSSGQLLALLGKARYRCTVSASDSLT